MYIALDFCLTVDLKMPKTVELSVSIGVGGCWWPSSSSVAHIGIVVCPLWKSNPISDSAADART